MPYRLARSGARTVAYSTHNRSKSMNGGIIRVTRIGHSGNDIILKRNGIGHGLGRLCSAIRNSVSVEQRTRGRAMFSSRNGTRVSNGSGALFLRAARCGFLRAARCGFLRTARCGFLRTARCGFISQPYLTRVVIARAYFGQAVTASRHFPSTSPAASFSPASAASVGMISTVSIGAAILPAFSPLPKNTIGTRRS